MSRCRQNKNQRYKHDEGLRGEATYLHLARKWKEGCERIKILQSNGGREAERCAKGDASIEGEGQWVRKRT